MGRVKISGRGLEFQSDRDFAFTDKFDFDRKWSNGCCFAGLISERENRDRSGIPILDQISSLSPFVTRNAGTTERTELIMFIRPQIIRNGADASRIAQELRAKLGGRIHGR